MQPDYSEQYVGSLCSLQNYNITQHVDIFLTFKNLVKIKLKKLIHYTL